MWELLNVTLALQRTLQLTLTLTLTLNLKVAVTEKNNY